MKFTLKKSGVIVNIIEASSGYANPKFDVSPYTSGDKIFKEPSKNVYTGEQFVEELTDTELEAIMNKAKTSDPVAAVWERIKISGIDCNDSKDLGILDKMQTATIIDSTRKAEIIG